MNLNNKNKIIYVIFCICFTWFVNCWLAQYTIGLKEGIYIYSLGIDFNSLIDSLYGSLFIPLVIIFICAFYIIKDSPPTKSDLKNIKRFKIFLFLNIIAFILINYYVSYDTIILFS